MRKFQYAIYMNHKVKNQCRRDLAKYDKEEDLEESDEEDVSDESIKFVGSEKKDASSLKNI